MLFVFLVNTLHIMVFQGFFFIFIQVCPVLYEQNILSNSKLFFGMQALNLRISS